MTPGLKFDDIIPAWRSADSVDGKLYGVPYDGEVTIQVYRKDLYDAKGLKPADTLEADVANAAALNNPNDRIWGCALRGVAGAGQNMYIYPSIFREFGGNWMEDGKLTRERPRGRNGACLVCRRDAQIRAGGGGELELAHIADAFSQGTVANYIDAHSSASVINNPEKSKVIGKLPMRAGPGSVRQAHDLDLELGLSDQRRAIRQEEKGNLAVHPVGGERRDPGPHGTPLCRTDQALRRQPHLDLERS